MTKKIKNHFPKNKRKINAFRIWLAVLTMTESISKTKDVMTHYFIKTRYFIMLFESIYIILPERNIFPIKQEAFGEATKAKPPQGMDFTKKTDLYALRSKAAFLLRFG